MLPDHHRSSVTVMLCAHKCILFDFYWCFYYNTSSNTGYVSPDFFVSGKKTKNNIVFPLINFATWMSFGMPLFSCNLPDDKMNSEADRAHNVKRSIWHNYGMLVEEFGQKGAVWLRCVTHSYLSWWQSFPFFLNCWCLCWLCDRQQWSLAPTRRWHCERKTAGVVVGGRAVGP